MDMAGSLERFAGTVARSISHSSNGLRGELAEGMFPIKVGIAIKSTDFNESWNSRCI